MTAAKNNKFARSAATGNQVAVWTDAAGCVAVFLFPHDVFFTPCLNIVGVKSLVSADKNDQSFGIGEADHSVIQMRGCS